MRPNGSPEQLEKRRREAIALLLQGKTPTELARKFDITRNSVYRWLRAYQKGGAGGLKPKPSPGAPSKLKASHKKKLEKLLLESPLAQGYTTDLWTLKRVAKLIRKHFGVAYHPHHVWHILRGMGWSCQKPERRAIQRDEEAVQNWKKRRWPHIKKRRPKKSPSRLH